ncbi:MAG: class I SAM-dependent methyltransferase [Pyrinomonadaceae bacterium]
MRCTRCGYVFADSALTDQDFYRLYNDGYFCGGAYTDYVKDERVLRKNFRARARVIQALGEPQRHRRLLEIGSAYGFFLKEVENQYASVEGIDITEAGTRFAREELQLSVVQGDFLDHDYGSVKFDVICLWDTIEHLRAPDLYIAKMSALTEPGALLALTTGDIESANARLRGRRWRLIHPPSHLHYFSPQTLRILLDRYGFEIVYNKYCGFYRSVDNMAHNILVARHKRQRIYETLRRSGLSNFDLYLNLYDIMFVIARKRLSNS